MANAWYNQAKGRLLNGDLILSSDTIKAMLLKGTSYSFDKDHDAPTDLTPASNEVSGGSYARQTLGTKSGTVDDTNDLGYFSCGTITFSAVPAQGGSNVTALVIYEHVTNDTDSRLIAYFDTGTGFPLTPNGGDITVTIAATGLLKIT